MDTMGTFAHVPGSDVGCQEIDSSSDSSGVLAPLLHQSSSESSGTPRGTIEAIFAPPPTFSQSLRSFDGFYGRRQSASIRSNAQYCVVPEISNDAALPSGRARYHISDGPGYGSKIQQRQDRVQPDTVDDPMSPLAVGGKVHVVHAPRSSHDCREQRKKAAKHWQLSGSSTSQKCAPRAADSRVLQDGADASCRFLQRQYDFSMSRAFTFSDGSRIDVSLKHAL
jgi:hypothetical protein